MPDRRELSDLVSNERDFDTDLMTAGCRLAVHLETNEITVAELFRINRIGLGGAAAILDKLLNDGVIDEEQLKKAIEAIGRRTGGPTFNIR
jgi:hypothetical protein